MTETLVLPKKLSEADYLSGEEDGLVKHEYVDGVLYAMSGASIPHNELAGELYYILRNHPPRDAGHMQWMPRSGPKRTRRQCFIIQT